MLPSFIVICKFYGYVTINKNKIKYNCEPISSVSNYTADSKCVLFKQSHISGDNSSFPWQTNIKIIIYKLFDFRTTFDNSIRIKHKLKFISVPKKIEFQPNLSKK